MRQHSLRNVSPRAGDDSAERLALGYHGTLQPDPALYGQDHFPAQMEEIVDELLKEALNLLGQCSGQTGMVAARELPPMDGLLHVLRDRVRGILTQAVAIELQTPSVTALDMRILSSRYPALSRLLHLAVVQWVKSIIIFRDRLWRDKDRLAKWFGVAELPMVDGVAGTVCDPHEGGQMTLRVAFRGGQCIFYKPRPVTGEWLWERSVAMMMQADPTLNIPAVRVLQRGTRYGWAQSALDERSRGTNPAPFAADDYWRAAGAVLCLAHHVCMTDLHMGNVIAAPGGPVIIDAECLGSPANAAFRGCSGSGCEDSFGAVLSSLLDMGLIHHGDAPGGHDISGLFGGAASVTGVSVPHWASQSGGNHRLSFVPAALIEQGNRPRTASLLAVLPDILDGYRHAAEALLRCRKQLLASGSSWRYVLQEEHAPRVVVRNTFRYGVLLGHSLRPELLRSTAHRRSSLWTALTSNEFAALPSALVRTELRALLDLHVPRLGVLPGTKTLASASGRPIAYRFVQRPPAERVLQRINALCPRSLNEVHAPALMAAALAHSKSSAAS